MNNEDYVSLEVAKLLKEKGYNEPVLSQYSKQGSVWNCYEPENFNESEGCFSRPTLYEAQKWLRNKHNLHIDVGMCGDYATDADGNKVDEWDFWTFDMYSTENFSHHIFDCFGQYDTYEEALNEGILEALKLI